MGRISKTGYILQDVSKPYHAKSFKVIASTLDKTMGGKSGIYALYNDRELYYVGKANDLKNRIKCHLKNQHAGKWNTFRVFMIKNIKNLRDVETIILTVYKPKGNTKGGIFPKGNMDKIIQKAISNQKQMSDL